MGWYLCERNGIRHFDVGGPCCSTLDFVIAFLYARWKRDVLWYGDVRPVLRLSVRPSIRPSVTLLMMTVSVHFLINGLMDSNDIWYIDVSW
jgi:hypothetical protein